MVFKKIGNFRFTNSRKNDDIIEIDEPPEKDRFKYRPFKKKPKYRKFLLLAIIAVVVLIILAIFWWWPSWFAGVNLNSQL